MLEVVERKVLVAKRKTSVAEYVPSAVKDSACTGTSAPSAPASAARSPLLASAAGPPPAGAEPPSAASAAPAPPVSFSLLPAGPTIFHHNVKLQS